MMFSWRLIYEDMPRRLSYAEVSRRFKERGFTLITPYYERDTQNLSTFANVEKQPYQP
jgi:hypothetical protein